MITDKLFTGQQREEPTTISTLGLYNYGARFYSTLVGRFVSPDPFVPDASEVSKALGPALMVTLPSGFSGSGRDSVHGPVVGLMRGEDTVGLYVYVPTDDEVPDAWPAEGFTPRQHLLGVEDLNAEHAPGSADEPSGWPRDTFAPNPQPLNRFAYVVNNPLRYTDPNGYGCGPLGGFCDWVADKAGDAGELLSNPLELIERVEFFAMGSAIIVGGVVVAAAAGVVGVLVLPAGPPGVIATGVLWTAGGICLVSGMWVGGEFIIVAISPMENHEE